MENFWKAKMNQRSDIHSFYYSFNENNLRKEEFLWKQIITDVNTFLTKYLVFPMMGLLLHI